MRCFLMHCYKALIYRKVFMKHLCSVFVCFFIVFVFGLQSRYTQEAVSDLTL